MSRPETRHLRRRPHRITLCLHHRDRAGAPRLIGGAPGKLPRKQGHLLRPHLCHSIEWLRPYRGMVGGHLLLRIVVRDRLISGVRVTVLPRPGRCLLDIWKLTVVIPARRLVGHRCGTAWAERWQIGYGVVGTHLGHRRKPRLRSPLLAKGVGAVYREQIASQNNDPTQCDHLPSKLHAHPLVIPAGDPPVGPPVISCKNNSSLSLPQGASAPSRPIGTIGARQHPGHCRIRYPCVRRGPERPVGSLNFLVGPFALGRGRPKL